PPPPPRARGGGVWGVDGAGGGGAPPPRGGAAGGGRAPAGGDPPAHAARSQAGNVNSARYRMSVPPERLLVWSSSHAPRAVAGARTIPATGRAVKNPWRQVAAAGRGRRHFWTVPEKGTYSTGAGIEACKTPAPRQIEHPPPRAPEAPPAGPAPNSTAARAGRGPRARGRGHA